MDEPLRFAYESTGIETFFQDEADPEPRSRRVFAFHKPETLAEWVRETQTLRARLRAMPAEYPLITTGLWEPQVEAITNLERSFSLDKPRALIQMATGSGKTFTAVNSVYRLIKFAKARRVLFLVDRNNLGRQALREFQAFVTPDDGRKFTELYNAQRLTTNVIDPVNKVVITTIQYGTSEKANLDPSGIPVLRMGNIQDGNLDFGNLKYLPCETPKLNDLLLDPGDILFNRTNSAELVGKTAMYKSAHPKATFASYLIRVKACDSYLPELVSYYINSFYGRKYIATVVSQQVGQANVNGTKLANMPIIVPPLDEQIRVVAELERRFSIIEELETTVKANLTRAERARQAILKRAFEGKLVPHDPEDEPASKMLERIGTRRNFDQRSRS